jgi:LysR family transcriptional regulator, hydrogen peroxide-inducible genes activator
MELHQLRYFTAVADLGSFTKAAQRCLVAQPSLSQQIIKLEKELGQPLFERLGRMIRLTDAGHMLHDQAVAILASVEEAKNRVSESFQEGGTVTVGAIPTVAPYLLPPIVCAFKKEIPEASVVIHEDLTEHTLERCLRGELDVGVLALPLNDQRLHVAKLLEEELLLALPVDHHLVKKRQISIDDLNGEPFILLSEMHCLGQQILAFCNRQACRPFVTCHSSQVLTVQELVSISHGVSLLPAMACALDRHPRRRYRRLSGEKPTRVLALAWHKQRYQRPIVKRFIEFVKGQTEKPSSS